MGRAARCRLAHLEDVGVLREAYQGGSDATAEDLHRGHGYGVPDDEAQHARRPVRQDQHAQVSQAREQDRTHRPWPKTDISQLETDISQSKTDISQSWPRRFRLHPTPVRYAVCPWIATVTQG